MLNFEPLPILKKKKCLKKKVSNGIKGLITIPYRSNVFDELILSVNSNINLKLMKWISRKYTPDSFLKSKCYDHYTPKHWGTGARIALCGLQGIIDDSSKSSV